MYRDDEILGSIASEEEIVTSGLGAGPDMDGPIELPAEEDPFAFLTSAGASSPLQSAISILFTGTLAIVLYGSLRKRVKLVKGTVCTFLLPLMHTIYCSNLLYGGCQFGCDLQLVLMGHVDFSRRFRFIYHFLNEWDC